ncbi:MAG: Enoyl-[acyl-carrier-protein] reductase [NADH] [Candidatus Celerinatantimonas neptuna]|nr:MAG: Enoyl-[acyl-carrier-protein] reductase [NADH] [Candidatus Celerinatantimonas neptuna]
MIIKPKIRGFICTTTHPTGCEAHVNEQIRYVQNNGNITNSPKRVLVIGASTGYGLASRITAAFGCGASTLGVFLEKAPTEKKTGSAGWYNSAAFEKASHQQGLYAKSINGDAFSDEIRQVTIDQIRSDLEQVDLVVYSLASPVRKMPDTGEVIRSTLKPIGETYTATAVDTNKDEIFEASIEPANQEEIDNTVKVMGGQDWELWIDALKKAGVLAKGSQTVAYSYIGADLTWPIYWHGTIGQAKKDLDRAATAINSSLSELDGQANVTVLKSVVTQASAAIPVMPLYLSMVFKIMQEKGLHEGCIEQIHRLFDQRLYGNNQDIPVDKGNRIRLDDWELKEDVQQACRDMWPQITTENLQEKTAYQLYKDEFMRLFGFGLSGVDYNADVSSLVEFNPIQL